MTKTVIVTGASSGFGALTSRALADAGHVVYAGIRETAGRNAPAVAEARAYPSATERSGGELEGPRAPSVLDDQPAGPRYVQLLHPVTE
jgi:NAD(P)-dependent dehydrogenase (short-subunit alcohol dehydrogenase family)